MLEGAGWDDFVVEITEEDAGEMLARMSDMVAMGTPDSTVSRFMWRSGEEEVWGVSALAAVAMGDIMP